MEIFKAVCDFVPPSDPAYSNILSFNKGDKFEILEGFGEEKKHKEWWGARGMKNDAVGYVPAKYMKYEERKVGKLLPENYKSSREDSLRKLAEMHNGSDPDDLYKLKDLILEPDYDVDSDKETDGNDNDIRHQIPLTMPYDQWKYTAETSDKSYPEIPEPDYNSEDDDHFNINESLIKTLPIHNGSGSSHSSKDRDKHKRSMSEPGKSQGFIEPKKLPNPCIDSRERQELHREILHNKKMGIDVLRKKSELRKELDKRKESQRRKEWEQESKVNKRTSLEVRLEKQAQKIKEHEEQSNKVIEEEDDEEKPEFLKVGERIRSRSIHDKDAKVT